MKRKNLETKISLGVLMACLITGNIGFAEKITAESLGDYGKIEVENDDLLVEGEFGYSCNIELDEGYKVVFKNESGNSIYSGCNGSFNVIADNVEIIAGADNGIFMSLEGEEGTVVFGTADRKIENFTISAAGQGIDNKRGSVTVHGSDTSTIYITSQGYDGKESEDQSALNTGRNKDNKITDGRTFIEGGTVILTANGGSGIFTRTDNSSTEIIAADSVVIASDNQDPETGGLKDIDNAGIKNMAGTTNITANGGIEITSSQYGILAKKGEVNVTSNIGNIVYAAKELVTTTDDNGFVESKYYGSKHSIKADGASKVNIIATAGDNTLYGVVSAIGDGAEVTLGHNITDKDGDIIEKGSGSNYIYSSAHGSKIEDENNKEDRSHVVAAVYAQNQGKIDITASEGSINYIESHFDFVNGHEDDREITVWAQNGGNVNINGAVYIASSNAGNYTVDKNGNPVKGNALGIAVSAGGRTITDADIDGNGTLNPYDGEFGRVNINYGSDFYRSMIVGDVVAGYGGEINITSGIMSLVDEGFTQGHSLTVKGNILAANGGSTNVDFGSGGYWEGRADDYGDANLAGHEGFYNPAFSNNIVAGGQANVKMDDGYWNVTAQSWLTSFEGDNNTIDMVSYEDNGTHAVSIKKLTGENNTFIMGLNHKTHANSDMLYIKDGNANIDVVVSGTIEDLDKVSEKNGLRFATVGDGITFGKEENGRKYITGKNTGMFNTKLYVRHSDYDKKDTDNAGYNGDDLTANKPGNGSVEDFFNPDEDKPQPLDSGEAADVIAADNWEIIDFAQDDMSEVGKTVLDLSKVNYSNAVYMDRFNKRMGEARFIDGDEGMWVRLRHDRIGKEDSFRSMNTMYEIGYDAKQVKEDGEHRVGLAIDYMDGSSNFSQVAGTGEVSRKGLWLYDSWMGEKGHYRDFVAKWGHLSNDFEFMAGSDKAKADFSNNVYSISAEFGKKNDIGNSWYFEPQAQVQYAHVTGAEYTTSLAGADQTAIRNDSFNSLIARAGFRLGKDLGERSTVYFKADVLHEFLGDQEVYAKDGTTSGKWQNVGYDHSGTWCDIGFGFATAMSKTSYAYLDVETSLGNDYDETYQINAGLQWSF